MHPYQCNILHKSRDGKLGEIERIWNEHMQRERQVDASLIDAEFKKNPADPHTAVGCMTYADAAPDHCAAFEGSQSYEDYTIKIQHLIQDQLKISTTGIEPVAPYSDDDA